jgi:hypothetical protein
VSAAGRHSRRVLIYVSKIIEELGSVGIGNSVLLVLLCVHSNTMSGQGGHGSRGRCFRYNMGCGRTGFSMGRQPVREEDNGAVDDLREG